MTRKTAGVAVASVAGEVDAVEGWAAGVGGGAVGLVVDLEAHDLAPGDVKRAEVVHGFGGCCV